MLLTARDTVGGDASETQRRCNPMSLQITLTGQLAAEADDNRADATDLPGRQASVVFAFLVAERARRNAPRWLRRQHSRDRCVQRMSRQ